MRLGCLGLKSWRGGTGIEFQGWAWAGAVLAVADALDGGFDSVCAKDPTPIKESAQKMATLREMRFRFIRHLLRSPRQVGRAAGR